MTHASPTPWQAFFGSLAGIPSETLQWSLLTVFAVFALWAIAVRRRSWRIETEEGVLFLGVSLVGWGFLLNTVLYDAIDVPEDGAVFHLYVTMAAATLVTVVVLLKKGAFQRVISGVAAAVVGFGLIASMHDGSRPKLYALAMGGFFGLSMGQFLVGSLSIMGVLSREKGAASSLAPDELPPNGEI